MTRVMCKGSLPMREATETVPTWPETGDMCNVFPNHLNLSPELRQHVAKNPMDAAKYSNMEWPLCSSHCSRKLFSLPNYYSLTLLRLLHHIIFYCNIRPLNSWYWLLLHSTKRRASNINESFQWTPQYPMRKSVYNFHLCPSSNQAVLICTQIVPRKVYCTLG